MWPSRMARRRRRVCDRRRPLDRAVPSPIAAMGTVRQLGIVTWIGFALNQVLVPTVVAAGLGALGSWTGRAMAGVRQRRI